MPIPAGRIVTAAQLNRIQPRPHHAVGSGTLAGPLTNAPVVGASITVTTETWGATYQATCVWDIDTTGTATATGTGRLQVNGSAQTPLAAWSDAAVTDRAGAPQTYLGTLGAPGTHTLRMVASPTTGQSVLGVNCSVALTIYEAV